MPTISSKKIFSFISVLMLSALCVTQARADCCCPQSIDITAVPFTITQSNTTYCVKNQLSFAGASGAPAITISPGVHDVIVNFNGFDLTLANSRESGIRFLGDTTNKVSNIVIKNGTIQSATPSTDANCTGVDLVSPTAAPNTAYYNHVTFENMRFLDTRRGITEVPSLASCFDLTVRQCQFSLGGVTTSRGLSLGTIQGLVVEECSFLPNPIGSAGIGILLVNNCANVSVQRCKFNGMTDRSMSLQGTLNSNFAFPSSNFLINECEIYNCSVPFIGLSIHNITFTNCAFLENEFEFVYQVPSGTPGSAIPSGLIIDHCTFYSTSQETPADLGTRFLRLGGPSAFNGAPRGANDIIVRDSTFTYPNSAILNDDIFAFAVDGLLIENCVFNSTSTGRDANCAAVPFISVPDKSANIHLGGALIDAAFNVIGGSPVKNVTIRGNQLGSASQVSIYADTSIGTIPNQNILIEDNNITATENGILFENTIASEIRDNHVSGVNGSVCIAKGVGIQLSGPTTINSAAASNCNAILNNTVINNGIGIDVECGAEGNLIQGNRAFNNTYAQILIKDKKHNVKKDNTEFRTGNCSAEIGQNSGMPQTQVVKNATAQSGAKKARSFRLYDEAQH